MKRTLTTLTLLHPAHPTHKASIYRLRDGKEREVGSRKTATRKTSKETNSIKGRHLDRE